MIRRNAENENRNLNYIFNRIKLLRNFQFENSEHFVTFKLLKVVSWNLVQINNIINWYAKNNNNWKYDLNAANGFIEGVGGGCYHVSSFLPILTVLNMLIVLIYLSLVTELLFLFVCLSIL